HGRVTDAFQLCTKFCVMYGIAVALLLAPLAPWLVGLFDNDPQVHTIATRYLWIVPFTLGGYGITIVAGAGLNALGRPMISTAITAGRMLLIYLPGAFIGYFLNNILIIFVFAAL